MIQNVLQDMQSEIENLNRLIAETQRRLSASTVEGRLRVSYVRARPQCFMVNDQTDRNGRYLRKDELELKKELAQADYDRKMLQWAVRWRDSLQAALDSLPKTYLTELYAESPYRRQLVTAKIETDQEFVADWEKQKVEYLCFNEHEKQFLSKRGEKVRSKSEKIIADMLFDRGIPYRYEPAVVLSSQGTHRKWCQYPDFVILDVARRTEVVLEHFGLVTRPEYATRMVQKVNRYIAAGYEYGDTFLVTFEADREPLDIDYLKRLFSRFENRDEMCS